MARLPDEQWAMIEDSIDKKRTAASAFKQRTHCGKGGRVKFPSDNLSKKELKAMSGECKSYRLNDPMSWDEFKSMPDDLKVTYINGIRERFGAPDKYIAEMFGISQGQLGLYLHDLKLEANAKVESWEKESFLAWRSGADTTLVKENEPEVEVAETMKYTWKPMAWEDFKRLSDENKIDYVRWIREKFKAPDKAIGAMLGISQHTISVYLRRLNFSSPSTNGKAKWDKEGFAVWQNSKKIETPKEEPNVEVDILEEVVEDLKAETTTTSTEEKIDIPYAEPPVTELPYPERIEVRPEPISATPKSGVMTFESRADQALNMMAMVLGTCPVRMTITWERIEVDE